MSISLFFSDFTGTVKKVNNINDTKFFLIHFNVIQTPSSLKRPPYDRFVLYILHVPLFYFLYVFIH